MNIRLSRFKEIHLNKWIIPFQNWKIESFQNLIVFWVKDSKSGIKKSMPLKA